jgi:hypothetical protein
MKKMLFLLTMFLVIFSISSRAQYKKKVLKDDSFFFNLFVNDSLAIDVQVTGDSYDAKDIKKNVFHNDQSSDKTRDGVYFCFHKTSFSMYLPDLHAKINVISRNNTSVSDHFIWLLTSIRANRRQLQKEFQL